MPAVSVLKTPSYDPSVLARAVDSHFAFLNLDSLIEPSMKIVIKPNLIMRRAPEEGVTTHPALVAAIVKKLRSLGCQNILIAESGGGPYTEPLLRSLYKGCGYTAMAEETGVPLNYGTGSREVEGEGRITHRFTVIDPIAEADLVINVCKLKTHGMTMMSAAVKNLFGAVPGLMKPELHMRYPEKEEFCRMILDLNAAIPNVISFVDAVVGLEGDGPTGGTPKEVGLTLCSADRYALDLVNAAVLGMKPAEIIMLRQSIEDGLCPADLSQITLLGDVPADALCAAGPFQPPHSKQTDFTSHFPAFLRPTVKKVTKLIQPKPVIRKKDCIGCGKCAESCPAHTIRIENRIAVIDRTACIHCFCCHEMCPKQAIDIKRLSVFRL